MGLPGLKANPCPQILSEPPCLIMVKDLESQVYVPVPVPLPSHLPYATEDCHTSGKHPKNVCPHCSKGRHFGRECKTPHIYCTNHRYCKLQAKSNCKYPCAHGRQARIMCKKMKAQVGSGGDSGYIAGINEQELAINASSVLFNMNWSN